MCGICGLIDFSAPVGLPDVERMNEALRHRGPDMGGVHSYGCCILGHRRLSILDLSESAKQPMVSEDGSIAVVFNGEIYNFMEIRTRLEAKGHVFRTRSDTEALLNLYLEKQENMLEDLNGMFSFAIWDDRKKRVFLARDRMGKKPLYYHCSGPALRFSSELFSLMQDRSIPRNFWEQAFFEYLLYDFVPAPHTIFRDVRKLPAAHMAVFDSSGLHTERYWKPPLPEKNEDYQSQKSALQELLVDSVKLRLVADVPLGSFLSGGLDSSLVTALMTEKGSRRVKSFSISFPGTSHDESVWSDLAASAIGTEHTCRPVEYDIQDIFPKLVRHFGEPFGDSSAIPTWHLCRQTRQDVTVALCGDGGDELFGGYERYLARRLQLVYDLVPARLRERILEPFIDRLPATTDYYGTSIAKKLKLFVQACRRLREEPLAVAPRTFSRDEVRRLTGLDYEIAADPVIGAAREWAGLDPVTHMLFTDIQAYLAEDILTKADRMSMAHALEVRSPLLDYRIVEFACGLTLDRKIRGMTTKRILRDVARNRVPDSILKRSKYGFQVPLGAWFKKDLKNWAQERLFDSRHGLVARGPVETLWNRHQSGQADNTHKIWLLMIFNEWYEQFSTAS
jgi:asparagine synthase (glutamine-hydrolysing)